MIYDIVEDLRTNHEYCPEEVILNAAEEICRLRAVVERLGSMESFVMSRMADKVRDEELLARIDYARAALTPSPINEGVDK